MGAAERHILIVGASAAGLRCAARLRRLQPHWRIQVVEERPIFSLAACGLPYVLSGDIPDVSTLRRTADGTLRDAAFFESIKGIEVLTETRAIRIDPERRSLTVEDRSGQRELGYDELVLATGARARELPDQPVHPRVRNFHRLEDLAPLHEKLARGQAGRVILAGAGPVGIELAEAFSALWGSEVVLLEGCAHPLPGMLDAECGGVAARQLATNGVELHCGCAVERIEASDERVKVHAGGDVFEGDLAVVAIGIEPSSELARACGAQLGAGGGILVDEQLRTTVPNVWAAGDCVASWHVVDGRGVYLPLGSIANRMGRTLGNLLGGLPERFPPVSGASVVKLFEATAAATGLSREAAIARGLKVRSVWTAPFDRADYWPEVKDFSLQLTYEPGTRRLVGVQAVGEGDVAKRIDLASQLVTRRATLEEVAHLEHAYAPAYAPALDPLAVAAFVALNQEGGLEAVSPLDAHRDLELLDLRNPEEREAQELRSEHVTVLPLDALRQDVGRLEPRDWVTVCARGARAAEGARILQAAGLRARYLGGGTRFQALLGRE